MQKIYHFAKGDFSKGLDFFYDQLAELEGIDHTTVTKYEPTKVWVTKPIFDELYDGYFAEIAERNPGVSTDDIAIHVGMTMVNVGPSSLEYNLKSVEEPDLVALDDYVIVLNDGWVTV